MPFADFLAWNTDTGKRNELVAGVVTPIGPVADVHGLLLSRLTFRIGMRLKPPCQVYAEAGIALPDRETFYLADLVVACGSLAPEEGFVRHPAVVAEVLFPQTLAFKRGIKVQHYMEIPSLREMVLLDGYKRGAQLWRRSGERWLVETIPGNGSIRLESTDDLVPLPAIYGDLDL